MSWLDDYLEERWGPRPKQQGPEVHTFGPLYWYEWHSPFYGYTDFTGVEEVQWVNPVKWRDFMAAIFGVSPGCESAGMLLAAAKNQIESMEAMDRELDDNTNIQKSMNAWREQLALQKDKVSEIYEALANAGGDSSVCWMTVAIPLLYGFTPDKTPPPLIALVILQNQLQAVADFGVDLSSQSILTDSLVAAETELSRSAPGEDKTVGDTLAKAREHVDDFMGDPWSKLKKPIYIAAGLTFALALLAIAIAAKK